MSDKRVVDNYKSLPQQVIENTEYILSFEDRISGWDDKINDTVEKVDGQDSKISAIDTKVSGYDNRINTLESNSKSQASKISDIESKDTSRDSKIASLETDVNAISNSYVSTNAPQQITGTKTFTSPVKTDEIDNTNGNAMLRYKSTENKVVLGGSTIPTTIMGSGDRPTYSKNGSDFSGNELALKSDVDTNWSLLMANLGIGRWANQTFCDVSWGQTGEFYDSLSTKYTSLMRFLSYSKFHYSPDMILMNDYNPNNVWNATNYMFYGLQSTGTLELRNIKFNNMRMTFSYAQVKKIKVAEGCSAIASGNTILYPFYGCSNLEEVDGLDFGGASAQAYSGGWFNDCVKLKRINIKHIASSFEISASTAFEEADLVEIISNLDTVTTTKTLKMGATNLAKLTDDEKKVATDKGWVLA